MGLSTRVVLGWFALFGDDSSLLVMASHSLNLFNGVLMLKEDVEDLLEGLNCVLLL